jgi:RNA polymerase sigma-70 factor (ECF subfamily)
MTTSMYDPNAAGALARRIREGDAEAEADLAARYRAPLTMILRRQVRDAALAEDLCQDVFRIALPALREGRLQEDEKLVGYLWGIARHVARQAHRARRRQETATDTGGVTADAPRPDDLLLSAERARLLRRALGRLRPRDRLVLTAFYLTEVPRDEICRRVGISAAQFSLIKCRALKRLLATWRSAR